MAVQDSDLAAEVAGDAQPAATGVGSRGRLVRTVMVAVVAALILYGSIAGNDDKFPFGPFTMYSGYFPPNGVIISTSLLAQSADGHSVVVTQADTGIPRGDIEGELGAYRSDPGRLGDLAQAFHRRHPLASPYVEMRIVEKRWQLHNRVVASQSTVTLVEWHAP